MNHLIAQLVNLIFFAFAEKKLILIKQKGYLYSGQGLSLFSSKKSKGVVIDIGNHYLNLAVFDGPSVSNMNCFFIESIDEIAQHILSVYQNENRANIRECFKNIVLVGGGEIPTDKIQSQLQNTALANSLSQKDLQDRWQTILMATQGPKFLQTVLSKEEYDESGAELAKLPFPVYEAFDASSKAKEIEQIKSSQGNLQLESLFLKLCTLEEFFSDRKIVILLGKPFFFKFKPKLNII